MLTILSIFGIGLGLLKTEISSESLKSIKGTDDGLEEVIEFLKKHPQIIIEISGHTDEVGTDANNMNLSDRRAAKVKEIIVKAGVNTNRIYTIGFGETRPIATNSTSEGKLKNRRVEFKILE